MTTIKNNDILFDFRNPVFDERIVKNLLLALLPIEDADTRENMDDDEWDEFWEEMNQFDSIFLEAIKEKECEYECMYIVASDDLAVYVTCEIGGGGKYTILTIEDVETEFELEEFQA